MCNKSQIIDLLNLTLKLTHLAIARDSAKPKTTQHKNGSMKVKQSFDFVLTAVRSFKLWHITGKQQREGDFRIGIFCLIILTYVPSANSSLSAHHLFKGVVKTKVARKKS